MIVIDASATWKKHVNPSHVAGIPDLLRSYERKNMIIEPEEMYSDETLEIALSRGITVYDALCIAHALRYGRPLLTLDQRQREAASRLGIRIIP